MSCARFITEKYSAATLAPKFTLYTILKVIESIRVSAVNTEEASRVFPWAKGIKTIGKVRKILELRKKPSLNPLRQ